MRTITPLSYNGHSASSEKAALDVEEVLSAMTLTEKINLTTGADGWHTVAISRLHVPAIRVSENSGFEIGWER